MGWTTSSRERVLAPVLRGLDAEGERYVGVLYCGLMWTDDGPRVIEFNVRFGDPETQALVPRIEGDFAKYIHAVATGDRTRDRLTFSSDACVAVVLATPDYPARPTALANLPADLGLGDACVAFWGASASRDGKIDVPGGRVLTISARGETLPAARANAYAAVDEVVRRFPPGSVRYRSDIAAIASEQPA